MSDILSHLFIWSLKNIMKRVTPYIFTYLMKKNIVRLFKRWIDWATCCERKRRKIYFWSLEIFWTINHHNAANIWALHLPGNVLLSFDILVKVFNLFITHHSGIRRKQLRWESELPSSETNKHLILPHEHFIELIVLHEFFIYEPT